MRSKGEWLWATLVALFVIAITAATIWVFTGGPIIDRAGREWRVPL
jgi:hypothetical protein